MTSSPQARSRDDQSFVDSSGGLGMERKKIKVYMLFFKMIMWFERRAARRDVIAAAQRMTTNRVPGAVVLEHRPEDIQAVRDAVARLRQFGG